MNYNKFEIKITGQYETDKENPQPKT